MFASEVGSYLSSSSNSAPLYAQGGLKLSLATKAPAYSGPLLATKKKFTKIDTTGFYCKTYYNRKWRFNM